MGYFEYIFEVEDFEYTPLLFAHLWSNPVGSLKRFSEALRHRAPRRPA